MIRRVTDNMVKTVGQYRWQMRDISGQHPHAVAKPVGICIVTGQRRQLRVDFDSRHLHPIKPVGST